MGRLHQSEQSMIKTRLDFMSFLAIGATSRNLFATKALQFQLSRVLWFEASLDRKHSLTSILRGHRVIAGTLAR